MADFNPPAPPDGVRKTPINVDDVVDLQHRSSGANGFASVYRVWWVVGGDFNRDVHAPTLGPNPIGHRLSSLTGATGQLVSGADVYIKTTAPRQNNNDSWEYLGAWLNKEPGEDNVASYFDDRDGGQWLSKARWRILKLHPDGGWELDGTPIYSGDGIRILNLERFGSTDLNYRLLLGRGRAAINPMDHGDDLMVMHNNGAPADSVDWIIWKH